MRCLHEARKRSNYSQVFDRRATKIPLQNALLIPGSERACRLPI
jgi:hypothetical protein